MTRNPYVHLLTAVALAFSPSVAGAQFSTTPTFVQVDPRVSFYRAGFDAPLPALIIPLGPSIPGGVFHFMSQGLVQFGEFTPVVPVTDHFSVMLSNSSTLLDADQYERVPGALPLLPGVFSAYTGPSFFGNFVTDLDRDYSIPELGGWLPVPLDAQYLFISFEDAYYADNVSPDPENLGIWVTFFGPDDITTTPEPASVLYLLTGLVLITCAARWRERHRSVRDGARHVEAR